MLPSSALVRATNADGRIRCVFIAKSILCATSLALLMGCPPSLPAQGEGTARLCEAGRRFGLRRPRALCLQKWCRGSLRDEKQSGNKSRIEGSVLSLGGRGGCPGLVFRFFLCSENICICCVV